MKLVTIKPCTTTRRDERTQMLFLLLDIKIQPRIQLSQTHPSHMSSSWVRQERSHSTRLCMTWWLHVLLWLFQVMRGQGHRPLSGSIPNRRTGGGEIQQWRRKCVLLGRVFWRRSSVSLLMCTSVCDNYFLLPQAACSACLCKRLFLWLPWEEYFWCLPCAC